MRKCYCLSKMHPFDCALFIFNRLGNQLMNQAIKVIKSGTELPVSASNDPVASVFSDNNGIAENVAPSDTAAHQTSQHQPSETHTMVENTSQQIIVPLSSLFRHPWNVRKKEGRPITELAALILAQTLLQNLVVVAEK